MKKASSRSQRGGSKGIKGKHVLQICVLLGVCIWLIYQVKYSHDKKKEFYEKDGEKSSVTVREDGLVKLGRKDLLPGYHNNQKENEKEKPVEEDEDEEEISHGGEEKESKSKVESVNHEEEEKEEEEEVVEEDEEDKNKQAEEVVEEDEEENKHEEDEIDEIDEQDQSKSDELLEEEKERGSNDRVDEIDMTVDEARDEHYKADDASSAVSHESRILKTEKLKESSENSTETGQENGSSEVKIEKEPVLKLGEVETGDSVEKTTTEVKDGDGESSNSETKSAVTELTGETINGNSTEAILEASRVLQNETEIMQDRSQDHDKTEDGAPPAGFANLQTVLETEQTRNNSNPSITVSANVTNQDSVQDESRNSTSEPSLIENNSGSNTTEVKENLGSEGDDESGEKENSNLYSTEQTEEAEDTSETSISQEEREALLDPQTLPDTRIEGNEEDEEEALAAE